MKEKNEGNTWITKHKKHLQTALNFIEFCFFSLSASCGEGLPTEALAQVGEVALAKNTVVIRGPSSAAVIPERASRVSGIPFGFFLVIPGHGNTSALP
jgi:hypothetical protein